MGCCQSANHVKEEEEEEDEQGEQQIDIRFSGTSVDETERNTRSTVRHSQPRPSTDFGGPATFNGRYGSSRGLPSPSLSAVSLVPVARTGSYDVRVASRTRQDGGDGVIETSRLVVDHLKGNVFINQYLIIKDLGKGAHGTVKLVYNTQDDMLYAMKVIHKRRMRRQSYLAEPRAVANMMRNVGMSPLSQSQTEGQRGPSPLSSPRTPNGMTDEYSNEIAVMKELDHPNVVKLYEVIHDPSNNKLLMTMEYVEGGCVLAGNSPTQKVPILEATAVKYFRDVVKGLEYLHFNRIVHGDLKPDNLLMSSSGKVKISDFGSARFCEKSDMIFATAGTPSFMAPEMCQGKQFNGFPGDIWALGICLFMFVFGRPPFTGTTTYQIYEAIQRGELLFPPEIPVSAELKDILTRLLQKDPSERISLEEIPAHPWVTRGGSLPVLQTSNERAVQRVFEAMRKRNESGAKRPAPSTVPLAAPPEPVDMRKLVPDAEVRHFRDGEVIIAQGQLPEGLYYVQEGFVDMMLMPSEKKLVADEDFADAIDDEEDEEDEAVVTATANALDCRRSPASATLGEADDGSGNEEQPEDGDGDQDDLEEDGPPKGVDGFMALFGSRLSDRVSPMGSSPSMTPRNQSTVLTPRNVSQTLVARNHSATLAPPVSSQSLGFQRTSTLQADSMTRPYTPPSASLPLPAPLFSANSMLSPSVHPHPHPNLPQHLAHLSPASASRSQSLQASRTASQSQGTPAVNSPSGTSTASGGPTPRSESHMSTPFMAQGVASAGGALQTAQSPQGKATRSSYNGGYGSMLGRMPSYSSAPAAGAVFGANMANASISPSPLGLSCSNAASALDEQSTDGRRREQQTPAAGGPVAGRSGSRRSVMQEPSFNQRLFRHESGHRPPSRLSLTDSAAAAAASGLSAAAPSRVALLGRAASNRAMGDRACKTRSSINTEDTGTQPEARQTLESTSAGISSRRIVSARGANSSLGGAVAAPHFGSQPQVALPSSFSRPSKETATSKDDDYLFLSPMESRRLSVTAGGASSFRRLGGALGGAGIIVGASPPSGPPGSVSPAASIGRLLSMDSSNRPIIPPAVEEVIADAEINGCKQGSNDSIISNADISMHAANCGGWRREKPPPVQVSGPGLPGGVSDPAGFIGSDVMGSPGGGFTMQPRPIARFRSTMRRSATHANIMQPPHSSLLSAGGTMMASGIGPGDMAASCGGDFGGIMDRRPPLQSGYGGMPSRHPFADIERVNQQVRMRRHSTSSYQAGHVLTRILGVSTNGASLDRTSIQEWSTTSKLAQKAIQRSDSMHSRMAQMVLRAKQHAVRRKRRGSMELITTRGPGSVVGELCIDGKPAPSPSTVVAKGPVTLLIIKNEKVNKYRNQPSVMAALHRSQNASLVQEAMERFVECEQEVVAVEVIRRTITTEPNMHLEMPEEDTGEHHSSERLMADIYNG